MRRIAAALAALVAVVVFVRVSAEELPAWVVKRVGGADPLSVRGGGIAHYQVIGEVKDRDALIDIVRRRVDAWAIPDAWVGWDHRSRELVVVLPGLTEERMSLYHGLLEVGGLLEFRMVAHDQQATALLYREVMRDEDAGRVGIEGHGDAWNDYETDRQFTDFYLSAFSPAAIEAWLAALYQRSPGMRPPPDLMIAYELIDEGRVRTYTLFRDVHLGNGDIEDAEVTFNPQTNRAEVLVSFTRDGGERFGELTARSIGHKLAIMLDGEVKSAPVIQGAIRGGRSTITMGAGGPEETEAQARALVGVLRSGTLDVELREIGLEHRTRTAAPASLLAARGVFALGIGLLMLAGLLAARRLGVAALGDDLAGERLPPQRWPWARLAVTAGIVIGVWKLTPLLRLPTLNKDELANVVAPGGDYPSVFQLGIPTVLLAFVLVELVAFIVPPWRRLRHGGFAGRGALGPAVVLVALVLVGVQAWTISQFYQQAHLISPKVPAAGAVTVISLMTGTLVIVLLGWIADRWGLLGAWSTLLLCDVVGIAHAWGKGLFREEPWGTVSVGAMTVALLATGAAALITLAVLRSPRRDDPRPFVRGPAAGWLPLTGAFTVVGVVGFLWSLRIDMPDWIMEFLFSGGPPPPGVRDPVAAFYGTSPRFAMTVGLVIGLAALFAFLYSRPGVWREGRQRLRGGQPGDPAAERRAFARAAVVGGAWALAMVALYYLVFRSAPEALLPMSVALVTPAVIVDGIAEWRARLRHADLVTVWPLHQVQLADEVVRALAAERIPAHLRGLRFRSLMHFFGPEVPIAVMVPVADAERAHKLLAERLTPR